MVLLVMGCQSGGRDQLFVSRSTADSGLDFENTLEEAIDFNILNYPNYYNGGGVGIGDFDNDGFQDIFLTANQGENKLFKNLGDLKFRDITMMASISGKSDWSTGVAVADINADGWLDIYVCGVGGYMGRSSKNQLFLNQGINKNTGEISFLESAATYGLDISTYATQAVFFDYDNDGDLDMFLLNNSFHTTDSYAPRELINSIRDTVNGDKLFRNDRDLGLERFTEVTDASGILGSPIGFGLGVTCSDINGDGWMDLYISNDFHENDYLYINLKNGTFAEQLSHYVAHTSKYSMGNDIADFNNDGSPDIITMDMMPFDPKIIQRSMAEDDHDLRTTILRNGYAPQLARNCLQINREGRFSDIAPYAGVEASDWSWSPLFADFDNDGFKDLYISNGIYRRPNDLDYLNYTSNEAIQSVIGLNDAVISKKLMEIMPQNPISNICYQNNGRLEFRDTTKKWGLQMPSYSNGVAYVDLDNDGDLELVVNNINDRAFLFENKARDRKNRPNAYLKVGFLGNGGNTTGIGAKAIIKHHGKTYFQEQTPVRGFLSSMAHELHFGLGDIDKIDSLIVVWPDGTYEVLEEVTVNGHISVDQDKAKGNYYTDLVLEGPGSRALFQERKLSGLDWSHTENAFEDIHREFLIPRKLSTEGPCIAIGDVNGDGLDDIFTGNARGHADKLFLQDVEGHFSDLPMDVFREDAHFESVDAMMLDIDDDGDLDLLVASAGNEFEEGHSSLEDRLYLNDGTAGFLRGSLTLQSASGNTSCIAATDYDKDGDIDLFLGSMVVAGKYGISPKSKLLINKGGGQLQEDISFTSEFGEMGMVTDAEWADVDGDGWQDLVVVGQWMPLTIYPNNKGVLEPPRIVEDSTGWWNCVVADDFDNDGDMDLVAGNVGLNTVMDPSVKEPVRLYLGDFDNNGSMDPIMSRFMLGKEYAFATKDVLTQQLVTLRKSYLRYADYSGTTMDELLTKQKFKANKVLEAVEFQSLFFENGGEGNFRGRPLPPEANFAPIRAMVARDIDSDGRKDLLAAGNFNDFMPGMGRQDASHGLLLLNQGDVPFKALSKSISGVDVRGQVRGMSWLTLADGSIGVVLVRNDQSPVFLKMEPHEEQSD